MCKEQGADTVCVGTAEGNESGKVSQGQVVKDNTSSTISVEVHVEY